MKIESIIKRDGGTVVTLGKAKYHFKPEVPGGPHTADVSDQGHADLLLNIPEGYRTAGKTKPAAHTAPEAAETSNAAHVLQGNDDQAKAGGSVEAQTPAEQGSIEGIDAAQAQATPATPDATPAEPAKPKRTYKPRAKKAE